MVIAFCIGFCVSHFSTEAISDVDVSQETVVIEEVATEYPKKIFLGYCKTSAYCKENYPHICNNGDSTYTATMTTPTPGRTVAVDPNKIPYGTEIIIDGHSYIAEDCGGAIKGNRIDILFATHEEALAYGVQCKEVYYIEKGVN